MTTIADVTIIEGKTFHHRVRWASDHFQYVPISAISNAAPCRVTTAANHGIPNGWAVAVVSAKGMTELNAKSAPPAKSDFRPATFVSPNEIEFNSVSSLDFGAHTPGSGVLQFYAPMDLSTVEARWVFRSRVDGPVVLEADNLTLGGVTVSDAGKFIDIIIDVDETVSLGVKSGVYELEVRDTTQQFTYRVISGKVRVVQEIAT